MTNKLVCKHEIVKRYKARKIYWGCSKCGQAFIPFLDTDWIRIPTKRGNGK